MSQASSKFEFSTNNFTLLTKIKTKNYLRKFYIIYIKLSFVKKRR